MKITIIQPDIIWENKDKNLNRYENIIKDKCISLNKIDDHIVVLPEMFTTGFTMNPVGLSEKVGEKTTKWMLKMAETYNCVMVGSIITEENQKYYNRLYWIEPNGIVEWYDKKHLFAFAGENNNYTAGKSKNIVEYNGWRINLMVCYDLRFPVWSRNKNDYDMIIYVANWPEKRRLAWKRLLQARAIENQCYVVGVNRVGTDNNGNKYSGDSSVFSPIGDKIWQQSYKQVFTTIEINKELVDKTRNDFPFYLDSDDFEFKN
jgi:predicted amidohydrolase